MSPGSGVGRFIRLWHCCLLSVILGEQASGRRWDCSGLGHLVWRCFGTKWYSDVLWARSTRDGDTGNEDDLDKYAMFSFAMTSGLASDTDRFKIIIALCRAQKFRDLGPYTNFEFLFNPFVTADANMHQYFLCLQCYKVAKGLTHFCMTFLQFQPKSNLRPIYVLMG